MSKLTGTALLALCAFAFHASTASAGASAGAHISATKWKDIHSWRALGTRWAEAFDEHGAPLAVYDLAYPDLPARIEVAIIKPKSADLAQAIPLIQSAAVNASPSQRAKAAKLVATLEQLSTRGPSEFFPDGWWKSLPWKSRLEREPEQFRLSDLDFERVARNKRKFRKAMARIGSKLGVSGDLLARFELTKTTDGGYAVYFSGNDATRGITVTHPKKLIDFRAPRFALWEALAWNGLDDALGLGIGQIPIPILSALLGTAIHQTFLALDEMHELHAMMAQEALDSSLMDDTGSPFSTLDGGEKKDAARCILYSEASLLTVWRWLWQKPENEWAKSMKSDAQSVAASERWLGEQGEAYSLIHPLFAIATKIPNDKSIVMLADQTQGEPHLAVSYSHPNRLLAERAVIGTISTLVDFGLHWVPYVGSTMDSLYWYLVEKPIQDDKFWEARLQTELEQRELREPSESWDSELGILSRQRLNVFEPSLTETRRIVAVRRQAFGIPDPSHN